MAQPRISDEKRTEVIRLLKMGWTTYLIASELHMNKTTVHRIGASAGVHSNYKGGRAYVDSKQRALNREKSDFYLQRRFAKPGAEYGVPEREDE
jgi:hypothetical protein